MLAALSLAVLAPWCAPQGAVAEAPEASRLAFRLDPSIELWFLARAAAAGEVEPLALDGFDAAVEAMRTAGTERAARVAWSLVDAIVAGAPDLRSGQDALAKLAPRLLLTRPGGAALTEAASAALTHLIACESAFAREFWPARVDALEARVFELNARVHGSERPKHDGALVDPLVWMIDAFGMDDPRAQIPVQLVTRMPSPGGLTVRTIDGPICFVSVEEADGTAVPTELLIEKVLHEALHAFDALTAGDPHALNTLRQALARPEHAIDRFVQRDAAHMLIFAHAAETVRWLFDANHRSYAERHGIARRMGQTAEAVAPAWRAHRDGRTTRAEFEAAVVAAATARRPPNVLLILADDQGWADFSHLGLKDDVSTPRLDQLAAEGVSLTQAYASSPICNPSRVGLITGRYQQRWNNFYYGGGDGLPAEAVTLAERLRDAGYATGYFGKVHTGGPDDGPTQAGFPLNQGFDRFYGTTCGGRVHYLHHSREAVERYGEAAGQMEVEPMWDQDERVDWEGFTTTEWGAQAADFIRAQRDRPWFAFVNFNAVHNFAWQLPEEELAARGLEAFPDWNPDEVGYREWYRGVHRRDWPEGRKYYLAQLECLDREVGRLMDLVEQLGQEDNTLVVYTVDNGGCVPDWADNGPLAGSKYHLMEGGTRVRTFLKLPGVLPDGRIDDGVFSSLDLAPTICELAGVATERGAFDGVSQLAQLRGDAPFDANRTLHWDTGWQWSVRMGDWKLLVTVNEQRARGSANFEQVDVRFGTHLVDLATDPGETTNLAEEHPAMVNLLRQRHEAWRASLEAGEQG